MNTLVIYFSRDGHTKKVAESIAEKMGANIEEITEPEKRGGLMGFLRSGRESSQGATPKINPTKNSPADYDLVIVGTPVWAGNVSSPVRTYLKEHGSGIKKIAFFCTAGGEDVVKTFDSMRSLSGREPVALASFVSKSIDSNGYLNTLNDFVKKLA
jgi:flavodoxin